MNHFEERERAQQIVDARVFAPLIDGVEVSEDKVEGMLRAAESILHQTGVTSTVNGVPAIVSEVYVPTTVVEGRQPYYARLFRLLEGEDGKKELPGIGFDETPDVAVVTSNMRAVRFMRPAVGNYCLRVDNPHLGPEIDDKDYVTTVSEILKVMAEAVTTREAAKQQARQERRHAFTRRLKYKWDSVADAAPAVGGWALAALAAGGAIFGVGKLISLIPEDFDTRDLTELDGGTVLEVGDSDSPEFSRQLISADDLVSENVPNLEDPDNSHNGDEELNVDSQYRDVWLRSSKHDSQDNCQTIPIEDREPGTELVVWTDFRTADGLSRADELEVRYEADSFTACWVHGEERNDDDDARVVVDLRPASVSQQSSQN